eukprot:COSAG06_NODE_560_length_14294_cov_16.177739_13_plen_105_part_00
MAWNAAKAHPTFGKFAMGAEKALDAAIKGSDTGLKAIDLGERATRVFGMLEAQNLCMMTHGVSANPMDARKTIASRDTQKDWRPTDPRVVYPRTRQVVAFQNNR